MKLSNAMGLLFLPVLEGRDDQYGDQNTIN
jgi:hypothetical protein